jgi:hypothetical protein
MTFRRSPTVGFAKLQTRVRSFAAHSEGLEAAAMKIFGSPHGKRPSVRHLESFCS